VLKYFTQRYKEIQEKEVRMLRTLFSIAYNNNNNNNNNKKKKKLLLLAFFFYFSTKKWLPYLNKFNILLYTHVTKRKINKHWNEGWDEVPNEKTRSVMKRWEKVVEYFMLRQKCEQQQFSLTPKE
jgi:hypothetical protein